MLVINKMMHILVLQHLAQIFNTRVVFILQKISSYVPPLTMQELIRGHPIAKKKTCTCETLSVPSNSPIFYALPLQGNTFCTFSFSLTTNIDIFAMAFSKCYANRFSEGKGHFWLVFCTPLFFYRHRECTSHLEQNLSTN